MSASPQLDELALKAAERGGLEQAWRVLAPNVEQARTIRAQADKPDLLNEPRNKVLVRWFDAFERQIAAVETLYNAAMDPSLNLPLDDLRLARKTAEDLLEALEKTRELAHDSQLA